MYVPHRIKTLLIISLTLAFSVIVYYLIWKLNLSRGVLLLFTGSTVALGFLFSFVGFVLFDKILLSLLALLNTQISNIAVNQDHHARVTIKGNSELSKLAASINNMLTALEQADDALDHMSMYDCMTGLKNRAFFEQEMDHFESKPCYPVALIMCDVDGLKLVNDTLGHDAGDKLLIAAANILQSCFRAKDIVTRIGGDEFAILLPNSGLNNAERARKNIRNTIRKYNEKHPEIHLSMSVGIAVAFDASNKMNHLFKEADNNMYREKLHSSQSARSAIVHALMKTVEARDFITESHSNRMQEMAVYLGVALGLTEQQTNELRLLAQFHDIGKIGIPDRILSKPEPLTSEEYLEMQRHCEIGYRIAQSVPDLLPIAEGILKHHEWWNGSGYPQGLKGEEICLECRILAIADAYDAMTSDRPYRKTMHPQDAISELLKYAGSQFDPELVPRFIEIIKERKISENTSKPNLNGLSGNAP